MAVQQGLVAAENVLRRIEGRPVQAFAPKDKGSMAGLPAVRRRWRDWEKWP